jgi:putative protease
LRQSFAGRLPVREEKKRPLDLSVTGRAGEPLKLAADGCEVLSTIPLELARTRPLEIKTLRAQLGKLTETPFFLRDLEVRLDGDVILPMSEINRLRRELVYALAGAHRSGEPEVALESLLPESSGRAPSTARLTVLCRDSEHIRAALDCGIDEVFADFEDIRRYKEAVAQVRAVGSAAIFLATPRIQKAGEEGFFKLIANTAPDGVLVRNIGGISHFAGSGLRRIGDFSLNVANPVTARVFREHGLERLTISHDLNVAQILALVRRAPAEWFELTIHHHMPMFHMEHCVFAAFLSEGKDYTDCGRPCEKHRVHLKDRVGSQHPLRADVGCRNTLFNAVPQSGAGFFEDFFSAGIRTFRIELLEESYDEARRVIRAYQDLLAGRAAGAQLWRDLRASSQVGVTKGTYE